VVAKIQTLEKFSRWDSTDYLDTGEDIGLYFQCCLEDDSGDGRLICAALGDIAKARGIHQLAQDAGLPPGSVRKALSPDGNPEFATVMKVIKALGLKLGVQRAERVA
jgi:probable addiction module antidote protein